MVKICKSIFVVKMHVVMLLTPGLLWATPIHVIDYGNEIIDCSATGANGPTLLASISDCHTYYQCHSPLSPPFKRSCGFLLFNPFTHTCDWPANVIRYRQGCSQSYHRFPSMMMVPSRRKSFGAHKQVVVNHAKRRRMYRGMTVTPPTTTTTTTTTPVPAPIPPVPTATTTTTVTPVIIEAVSTESTTRTPRIPEEETRPRDPMVTSVLFGLDFPTDEDAKEPEVDDEPIVDADIGSIGVQPPTTRASTTSSTPSSAIIFPSTETTTPVPSLPLDLDSFYYDMTEAPDDDDEDDDATDYPFLDPVFSLEYNDEEEETTTSPLRPLTFDSLFVSNDNKPIKAVKGLNNDTFYDFFSPSNTSQSITYDPFEFDEALPVPDLPNHEKADTFRPSQADPIVFTDSPGGSIFAKLATVQPKNKAQAKPRALDRPYFPVKQADEEVSDCIRVFLQCLDDIKASSEIHDDSCEDQFQRCSGTNIILPDLYQSNNPK